MFVTVLGRYAGVTSGLSAGTGVVWGSYVNVRASSSIESQILAVVPDKYELVQVLGKLGDWYNIRRGSVVGYIRQDLIRVYDGAFPDVPGGEYYRPYVEWSYLCGISAGTSPSAFSPDSDITREQMCVMFYNYARLMGKSLPNGEKTVFPDDSEISSGAKDAVYALQAAGVISGKDGGVFDPLGGATRAEVAQIYMNFVKALG
jgi:hypothetical protein